MKPNKDSPIPNPAFANCADEPIRIPGRIQPHGALFVLNGPDLIVQQAGGNTGEVLGVELESVLNAPIETWIAPSQRAAVRHWLTSDDVRKTSPTQIQMVVDGVETMFDATAHRHQDRVILELENPGGSEINPDVGLVVRQAMTRLEGADSLQKFCQAAVEEVRAFTGFERVMVYRFDPDWHGSVVAEDKIEGLDPLLGLHFPATDIPEQARRLYVENRSRLIADVDASTVALVPQLDPISGEPVDLGAAVLRAVSPVHIQYLKNMGAKTSLSFSLIRDGRLWGLLSCMNYSAPRYIPPRARAVCEIIAGVFSMQLESKEEREGYGYRARLQRVRERLLQTMAEDLDLVESLRGRGDDLLALTAAQGAVVISEQSFASVGATPTEEQVRALVVWLRLNIEVDVFQTDSLPKRFPEAMAYKNVGCGLISITTSRHQGPYILWFRPEVLQSIDWGGDPSKSTEPDGVLNPRNSFARWKQEIHLKSLPWHAAEVEAAGALRDAIIAVVVRRTEELTRLNAELARSNNDLDAFAFTTSHDMKEPLRGIHNYATFLMEDYADKLDAEGISRLESLVRLSQRMEDLVESMLRYSQLGRAALNYQSVDLNELVAEVRELHRMMIEEGGVVIEIPRPMPVIRCDRVQVGQLFSNLIANAVKYNRKPRKLIEIGWLESTGVGSVAVADPVAFRASRVFYVKDDGIGIPEKHHQSVFRLFKRLHGRDKFGGGTGAGLTFVKKIVERHGGTIWVDSKPEAGTTFYFTLDA